MSTIDMNSALQIMQASIYLDACFLLILSDTSDPRYSNIKNLTQTWGINGNHVGISNHVYGGGKNTIFFRQIFEVLYLRTKELAGAALTSNQLSKIGDRGLADKLITLAGTRGVREYVNYVDDIMAGRARRIDSIYQFHRLRISSIIKQLKKDANYISTYRTHLNFHYEAAADLFDVVIKLLKIGYNLDFSWESSDENLVSKARNHISWYQLDAHDAIHFAVARTNGYEFIVTTDSDYLLSSYKPVIKNTKIIHIA